MSSPDLRRNRPDSKSTPDDWLTPLPLVQALGPFDLDPACPPSMPWRTARVMLTNSTLTLRGGVQLGDGLRAPWRGRVWLNPPYSDILPWVDRMSRHGMGTMLVPAKSTETRWGQLVLATADLVLFVSPRISFMLPDGSPSRNAWAPSILAAWGPRDARALQRAQHKGLVKGIMMRRDGL